MSIANLNLGSMDYENEDTGGWLIKKFVNETDAEMCQCSITVVSKAYIKAMRGNALGTRPRKIP